MGDNGGGPRGPRCIALVGPFQSGKTTLLEAILARTGAMQRQGTTDAGTTVGDASKEARDHKMSVELSAATTTFMGDAYTFIDCPGSVEFIHDMRAAPPGGRIAVASAVPIGAGLSSSAALSVAAVLSKNIVPGALFPIGIVTALIGVPFMIWLILGNRKRRRA